MSPIDSALSGGLASRPDAAYLQLKQEIMEGILSPGDHLPETDLAARMGVSRTPIREALRRLEHDGLIERDNRGLSVRNRSPEEILEIYEARIVLESGVARAAAERRTPADLVRIEGLLVAVDSLGPDRPDDLARANLAFHRGIWQAGHNRSLIDLLERINLHLTRYPATTLSYPGRPDTATTEHHDLALAIRNGDTDHAAEVAGAHFAAARDIRIAMWQVELAAV